MSFVISPGVIVPPLTAGGVAYGTGTQAKVSAVGTSGQALLSTGASVPTWGSLGVAGGGTGLSTLGAANRALYSTSASALTAGTLPAAAGGTGLTSPGTSGNVLTSNGTSWTSAAIAAGGLTYGTPITVTASPTVDFLGIPSTAKYILVIVDRLKQAINNQYYDIRLGDSGGYKTSGYNDQGGCIFTSGAGVIAFNNSFLINKGSSIGGDTCGVIQFVLLDTAANTWACTYMLPFVQVNRVGIGGGTVTLSSTLTQIQIASNVNGAGGNFTSGTLNIAYM